MNQIAERRSTLFLVHGRGMKPDPESLKAHWVQGLTHGLERDGHPALDGVDVVMIYYADVCGALDPESGKFDAVLDLADRQNAFSRLRALKSAKAFRRSKYEAVPGQSPLKEFLADLGVPVSRALGMSNRRLKRYYPELVEYWRNPTLARTLRSRLGDPLSEALRRGDHIMVISHCIGSVICYDAFWDVSQHVTDASQRIDSWITLGSPLADDDVRRRLGGQPGGFPNLLINWFNLAAEDDPVCHDETMANDFKAMLSERHISRIQDYHIYNLAERYGTSDPHAAIGYLVHPRTCNLVGDWLNARTGT